MDQQLIGPFGNELSDSGRQAATARPLAKVNLALRGNCGSRVIRQKRIGPSVDKTLSIEQSVYNPEVVQSGAKWKWKRMGNTAGTSFVLVT